MFKKILNSILAHNKKFGLPQSQNTTALKPKAILGVLASTGLTMASAAPLMASEASLADGTYLYGQSPVAEELGSEYLVFEVNDGNIAGAIYFPRSEFNCFTGQIDSQGLNLAIIDPSDNATYPYAIALEPQSPIATFTDTPVAMGLAGYHRLENLSDNDLRILNVCRGN